MVQAEAQDRRGAETRLRFQVKAGVGSTLNRQTRKVINQADATYTKACRCLLGIAEPGRERYSVQKSHPGSRETDRGSTSVCRGSRWLVRRGRRSRPGKGKKEKKADETDVDHLRPRRVPARPVFRIRARANSTGAGRESMVEGAIKKRPAPAGPEPEELRTIIVQRIPHYRPAAPYGRASASYRDRKPARPKVGIREAIRLLKGL